MNSTKNSKKNKLLKDTERGSEINFDIFKNYEEINCTKYFDFQGELELEEIKPNENEIINQSDFEEVNEITSKFFYQYLQNK